MSAKGRRELLGREHALVLERARKLEEFSRSPQNVLGEHARDLELLVRRPFVHVIDVEGVFRGSGVFAR